MSETIEKVLKTASGRKRKIFNLHELDYIPEKGMFKIPDEFWATSDQRFLCCITFRFATDLTRCV